MANVFWSNIFRRGDSELQVITQLRQETPLFKDIPKRHTATLCTTMHVCDFKADETIFKQVDQGAGAILVLDGEVRISAEDTVFSRLQNGDFFGEIALAAPERRTADATAISISRLVYFFSRIGRNGSNMNRGSTPDS